MIRRELGIFLVVGSLTVAVDYSTYQCLMWIEWVTVDAAKAASFLAGTLFAYFSNRFWTFRGRQHAPSDVWRFILLYGVTLLTNVAVNTIGLILLAIYSWGIEIAFLGATAISSTINFFGMKYFVFKLVRPLKVI